MRFKNFTLLFLMGIFGLFSTNLFAQDATITADEIKYWIGEGENEVVVAINWCSFTETALAWGYRFDGDATVFQALTAIADADSRLTVIGAAPTNITYVDEEYNLTMCPNPDAQWGDSDYDIPMHSVNGMMGQNMMADEPIQNGYFVKIGGYACGLIAPDWSSISWTTEIIPATDPNAGSDAVEATIEPAEIRYWIGEGENEVIFCVNWAEPDTALAWGYRFNEATVTVKEVVDAIVAADDRFNCDASMGFVSDITFNDGVLDLSVTEGSYFMYNVNGVAAAVGYDSQILVNEDFVKFGDMACGTEIAPWTYVWEKEVAAVYPFAVEAKIDPSEILYWIGEGENEVVFAVNWADPNKCLAWGYRFSTADVTVKTVMDAIAEADGRFDYDASWGFVSDITFNEGDIVWGVTDMSYFMYNVNGIGAMVGYDEQIVVNGDFIKWGDMACGTEIAPWTYVWEQSVAPASVYTNLSENSAFTLSVHPNPAVNETFVTIENAGLNEVAVYDIQGRLVSKQGVVAAEGEQVRISTETMNGGVYFVTVSNDSAVRTAKLVVK